MQVIINLRCKQFANCGFSGGGRGVVGALRTETWRQVRACPLSAVTAPVSTSAGYPPGRRDEEAFPDVFPLGSRYLHGRKRTSNCSVMLVTYHTLVCSL